MLHLVGCPEHLPERMPTETIIFLAEFEPPRQRSVFCRAHGAVVKADLLGKSARLPTFHPSREHCDDVDAPTLNRRITADGLKTFPAKELARARHVVRAAETE